MHFKQIVLLIAFMLCGLIAHAETFTVTSNADSGPNTLREALTKAAANGAAEKDFIYFNLPDVSEAGRTIILRSQLPYVTSNLVIDGSTQTGTKFGPSDAKVQITADIYSYNQKIGVTAALTLIQVSQTEIYGLYIYKFAGLNIGIGSGGATCAGIMIAGCQNIHIGQAGKGNWLSDCEYYILGQSYNYTIDNSTQTDITFQANYLGYESTSLSYVSKGSTFYGNNIIFGGDTRADGNHTNSLLNFGGENLKVINNDIGTNLNGQPAYSIFPNIGFSGSKNITVRDNIYGRMYMDLKNCKNFNIYRNTINGNQLSSLPAIQMYFCEDGVIGSDDINDINKFAGSTFASTIENSSSKNIQILKNSITCAAGVYGIYYEQSFPLQIPNITVLVNNNNEYSGTASPNSYVYIYEDPTDCETCSPVVFYTRALADTNGAWTITGNFTGKRWIANALLNENSSEFTQPRLSTDYYDQITVNPTCNQANGSISLRNLKHVLNVSWYDQQDNKIGEGVMIKDLAPGKYYAKCFNGNCYAKTQVYELYNISPLFFDSGITIKQPSCGSNNGAITGLNFSAIPNQSYSVKWTNMGTNQVVSTTADAEGLPPGTYLFTLTSGDCIVNYAPITLQNTDGPTINESNKVITQTTCNQATGSITGITATGTGTLTYSWRNSFDTEVGTTADLTNQPAGIYTLKVTDESACGPVYSSPIEITAINGVKLVTTNVSVRSSTCGLPNGYIKGLQAPGATTFIWKRDDGSVAGNTLDLENIPAGNYRLEFSNATCSSYADFRIDAVTPTVYPQFPVTITKTCAAFPTGTITVNTDGATEQPGILRWVDSQNNAVGFGKTIQYLPAGTYKLYLTDAGSCENFYKEYTVDAYPEFTVTFGNSHDIYCGVGKGSVDAATVSGGTGNYVYEWKDGNGNIIPGKTQPYLNDVDAGSYTISITDGGCNLAILTYTIQQQVQTIPAPVVANVEVTQMGNTTLQVTDAFPTAIYRLYDTETATTPLQQSQGGRFTVNVTGNRSYYIGLSYGDCESPRTRVRVVLTILNTNIPNTFTPNGDGFNDYWNITGIEESKIATVKIFNRSGQMVFQSRGYPKPFDGTYNGKPLPASTYYYIIEQVNAKPLSGYVTILR